ncbi:unnamed protein product [Oppiella nova]|uniref:RRM domain-containing protein n=1 Tax=Oppiella nova TaxID=334625 RepID=A0A7R9LA26_9ACAR|nr:unnamed protein product [Oppiella nova]CAG2158498.1 unnamed protein product [Oppiella nova]
MSLIASDETHINVNEIRKRFETKGEITDINVNPGKRHAIIGYKEISSAQEAIDYFHKTYIFTNKINVQLSDGLDKGFKKFSKNEPSIEDQKTDREVEKREKRAKKKKVLTEELDELQNDPEFEEFMRLQRNIDSGKGKHIWSNDMVIAENPVQSVDNDDEVEVKEESEGEAAEDTEKPTKNKKKKFEKSGHKKTAPKEVHEFVVKLKGLPYKVKKRQIKDFIEPLKALSLRLPPKVKGIAYLSFRTQKELTQVMVKHRGFMDGHRIEITRIEANKPKQSANTTGANKAEAKEPKWKSAEPAPETIGESGRIYVRNLSYTCDEAELRELFERYGQLSEFHLPIDSYTKKQKGFAFVSYVFPEHAVKAVAELDKTDFRGRLLHLIAAKPKPEDFVPPFVAENEKSSYKKSKQMEKKSEAQSSHQWNSLFIGANAVADIMAKKFNIKKSDLLADSNSKDSVAVRLALGETQIVNEMRGFLLENGVHLKAFGETGGERSKTVILVKNLPANTKSEEIRALFEKYGLVLRVILPPNGVTAIVEMQEINEAKSAFNKLAYNNFKHFPLYLEWAPSNVFRDPKDTTLFVKNLHFDTVEEDFRNHFQKCGQIYSANIAYKKSADKVLSMGYGFIQFVYQKSAQKALKELQNSVLDGHTLELKISNRTSQTKQKTYSGRNSDERQSTKQTGTKICVKNIPFEATVDDIKKLFSVFGELKAVRLPKKLSQIGSYRGFGFVDFVTKTDAKRAFDALCHSTHLYGRPLALEWARDAGDDTSDTEARRVATKTERYFQKALEWARDAGDDTSDTEARRVATKTERYFQKVDCTQNWKSCHQQMHGCGAQELPNCVLAAVGLGCWARLVADP